MPRSFNTTGPCRPDIHYMIPSIDRLPNLERLIEQQNYFVIHAPRQTGKSTVMMALAQQLTEQGKFLAVLVSAEVGAPFSTETGKAELAILGSWARVTKHRLSIELQPPVWPEAPEGQRLQAALEAWTASSPRPLVVFIDEIDSLQDEALISVLRQLRDGFSDRPKGFPQSIGLIGLRDVRDYKVAAGGAVRLNIASPFNIKVRSFTLRNFNLEDLAQLYGQHTQETGQVFTQEAIQLAFWLQHGEPLLNSASYHEIAPHLVMMAFLHRVVHGGGTLEREYAIGRDRMDLCLRYGSVTLGIEIKVQRDDRRNQLVRGLEQIDGYLARLGLDFGWLVIFDRRRDLLPIEERLRSEMHGTAQGRKITVIYA